MLTVWRICYRGLSYNPKDRREGSYLIAIDSENEVKAIKAGKEAMPAAWWEYNLLTDAQMVGKLQWAEGLEVPKEEMG